MTPTKRFLIGFAIVYAFGAVLGLVLWGPPSLSAEYEEAYGEAHEHYLEIIKNDKYKLYKQSPEAHPPDEHLAENIAFVEQYEANEAFEAEETRLFWFNLYFELFNGLALIILAVRFGKAPLLRFLDERISETRARIETAEKSRQRATAELKKAEEQIATLDEERKQILEQSENLAATTAAEIESSTAVIVSQLEREGEERQAVETEKAAQLMKREIVLLAMKRFEDQIRQQSDEAMQEQMFDQFLRDLEATP